jgi:hypothetical protein
LLIMVRTFSITVVVTSLVGFALGWFVLSRTPADTPATADGSRPAAANPAPHPAPGGAPAPGATAPAAVVRRFALRPGDVTSDRETPAVAMTPDRTLVLAWVSQASVGDNVRTLYIARSSDGGTTFEAPVAFRSVPIYRYTSGNPERKMAFSTHLLPRLAVTRDGLALGWVEAIDGGPTVRYLVALSRDGGKTFSEPVAVHSDAASKPGFTTLAADPDGGLACGWIEGRNRAPQPYFSAWPADSAGAIPEQLVFAGPEGKGICPCCDVAVAVAGAGADRTAFVAFRNSDSGHRDIWLARAGAGAGTGGAGAFTFTAPIAVSPEPWTFNGCPHDAPSLAVTGSRLHVVWMDAHTGSGRVYHAVSPLADSQFHTRPLGPQGRGAQGHPKLAAGGNGRLHAVWDEGLAADPAPPPSASAAGADGSSAHQHHHAAPTAGGAGRAIMYAVSTDNGASFSPPRALAARPGAYQLQPSLALGADGTVAVAWNELDEDGKHVVFVRLPQPAREP